jgi:phosphate transport system substrate-binding protein
MSIFIRVMTSLLLLSAHFAAVAAVSEPPKTAGTTKTIKWTGCGVTKQAFMDELTKAYEKKTGIKVVYDKGDSPLDGAISGIQDVNNGKFGLGGSCRTNLESVAEERNVNQVPLAWDALVFITHVMTPVDNITTKQAQDIYLGKIKNWKEVGGPNEPIELIVRRGKLSGVGRGLRELLFANYDQDFPGATRIVDSTGPLEKAIIETPYSLGATGISSAQKRVKEGLVKILKLNGMEPSFENIKSGKYVMYRPLYLVTKLSAVDKDIKDFISYAEVIRKTGTVPYSDAIGLVMKQIEQYDAATEKGLYNTQTNAERKK